jgi:hypothetical protein
VIETAKVNKLTLFDYVMNTLEQINHANVDIKALLPWGGTTSYMVLPDVHK